MTKEVGGVVGVYMYFHFNSVRLPHVVVSLLYYRKLVTELESQPMSRMAKHILDYQELRYLKIDWVNIK